MEKAAVAIADQLDLDLETRGVVVPVGPSPEGQARDVRYSEFSAATTSEEALLTAHTRDDSVETVLFNLIRGTGSSGLAGIPYFRPPNVFRPMLTITRSETREIAALAGLAFVDDPMNDDQRLTRNVVRSRVIPMLAELNPRLSGSIGRMAVAVASDNDYLEHEAARVPILQHDDSVGVSVGVLRAVPKPVADRILKTMLTRAMGAGGVTAQRVDGLWSVARTETSALQLEPGVAAVRRGPLLVIETSPGWRSDQFVTLIPGHHRSGRFEFDVLKHDRPCLVVPLSKWAAIFPVDTTLAVGLDGVVVADGEAAWMPGSKRLPVAWYESGSVGYLSVFAREVTGWTSNP
jgi:hypothetical protein